MKLYIFLLSLTTITALTPTSAHSNLPNYPVNTLPPGVLPTGVVLDNGEPDLSQTLGHQFGTDLRLIGNKIIHLPQELWYSIKNLPYYTGRLFHKVGQGVGYAGDAAFGLAEKTGHSLKNVYNEIDHMQDNLSKDFRNFVDRHVDEDREMITRDGLQYARINNAFGNDAEEVELDNSDNDVDFYKNKSQSRDKRQKLDELEKKIDDLVNDLLSNNNDNNSDETSNKLAYSTDSESSADSANSKKHKSNHPHSSAQEVSEDDSEESEEPPRKRHKTVIGFLGRGVMGAGHVAKGGIKSGYKLGRHGVHAVGHGVATVGDYANDEFADASKLTGQMVRGTGKAIYRSGKTVGRHTWEDAGGVANSFGRGAKNVYHSAGEAFKSSKNGREDEEEEEEGGAQEQEEGEEEKGGKKRRR